MMMSLTPKKFTAANIEGLSRRLDEEQEEEAAEAQLELEEAALQTNMMVIAQKCWKMTMTMRVRFQGWLLTYSSYDHESQMPSGS